MSYNFYTSAPPRAKKKERGDDDEIVNNAYAKIWSKFAKQPETEAKDKDADDDDDENVNNAYAKIWSKFAKQPETEAKDKDADDENVNNAYAKIWSKFAKQSETGGLWSYLRGLIWGEEEEEEEEYINKEGKKVYSIDGVEIDAEDTFLNFTFQENLPREIFVDVILSFIEQSDRLNFLTALWQTKMPRLQEAVRNLFRNKRFYEQIKPNQDKFVPKDAFDNQILTRFANKPGLFENTDVLVDQERKWKESVNLYMEYLSQFLEFVVKTFSNILHETILDIIVSHNSPIVQFSVHEHTYPMYYDYDPDPGPREVVEKKIDTMLQTLKALEPRASDDVSPGLFERLFKAPTIQRVHTKADYDLNKQMHNFVDDEIATVTGWGVSYYPWKDNRVFYLRVTLEERRYPDFLSLLASKGWEKFFVDIEYRNVGFGFGGSVPYLDTPPKWIDTSFTRTPKMPDVYITWALYILCFKANPFTFDEYISRITDFGGMLTKLNFTRKSLTEMLGVKMLTKLVEYIFQPIKTHRGNFIRTRRRGDFYSLKDACEEEIENIFNSVKQLIDVKELPFPPQWITTILSILSHEQLVTVSVLGPLFMKFLRPIMKLDKNDKLIDGRIERIFEEVNEKNRVKLQDMKDKLQKQMRNNPNIASRHIVTENINFALDIKLYCCSEYEKREKTKALEKIARDEEFLKKAKKRAFKERAAKVNEDAKKKRERRRRLMNNLERIKADFKGMERDLRQKITRIDKQTEQAIKDLRSGKQDFGIYTKPVIEEGDYEIIKRGGEKNKKRERERTNKLKLERASKEIHSISKWNRSPHRIKEFEWLISELAKLQQQNETEEVASLLKKARGIVSLYSTNRDILHQ